MVDWTGEHIGKYQVKKLLGQGGMGQVYQAFHPALERDVALKVIHTRLARDPEAVERFRREAKVVATLRHPGIIHVYDFDVEGDAFYMVMEFVPGEDLHEHLATLHQWGERLPLNEALPLFKSITEAVAYAHTQDVIHRDLKPSNVLLTAEGQPILVDFGLSKLLGAEQLTVQGMIMGTPQYMSPEQGTGGLVDARSDVYSLGVILYELTTGTRPFTSATPVGLILKHVSEPPAPPRSINPSLPEAVEQVIQKALAKDPAERYASAGELLRVMEALLLPPAGDQAETVMSLVDDGRCPYRGLQTFEAEQAEFFFGREVLINQLVDQVANLSQVRSATSEAHFLAVLGASGSGKSSLVRAGLVPALQQPHAQWVPLVMKPGSRPLEELAAQVASLEDQATDRLAMARHLLNHLSADGRALHLALRLAWAKAPAERQLLLVVDQFEELFTLCRDETERQRFIENLLYAATSQEGRIFVLLTMRADFYHRCAAYHDLAGRISAQQVLVRPMTEAELRRAIERPAETVGLRFEPGLVDTILAEVSQQPGALPLLEHALLELWERRERGLLSLAAYRDSGGVVGAIAQRAETLYNSFIPEEQAVARQVMLRLTQPGEGTEDTRRRARLSEFGIKSSTTSVIQRLTQARLLTLSRDAASGDEMVDVAHEALIRGWDRLRKWIDEDRAALRTHRRLTEAAEEWERHRRDESFLYQGARLAEAEEWIKTHGEAVNDLERAFVQASVEAREAAARAAQRARRRVIGGLVAGLAVVSLLLVVSLFLGSMAVRQWRRVDSARATAEAQRLEAERQRTLADSARATAQAEAARAEAQQQEAVQQRNLAETQQLEAERQSHLAQGQVVAAKARNVLMNGNPQLATLLALAAQGIAPSNEAVLVFAEAPYHYPPIAATLTGYTYVPHGVAYSPDGTLIASGAWGEVILWDAASGQPLTTLKDLNEVTSGVAFSPDGSLLAWATGYDNPKIFIWDVATLLGMDATSDKPIMTFTGHTGEVTSLAFSPDGTLLASGSSDKTIILWDVSVLLDPDLGQGKGASGASSQPLATFTAHTWDVNSVAFSPDGTLLASASDDQTVIIWEVAKGRPVTTFKGHTHLVESVAFSPDGTLLASGSRDNTIILWDVASGQPVTTLKGHTEVGSVVFSPDGTRLASGSNYDSPVIIWDVATGQPTATLKGHTGSITSLAWSPDGRRLASGSSDATIILWNVASDPTLTTLTGHTDEVLSIAFSPDGTKLASGLDDRTIILWDVARGQPLTTLKGHGGGITNVAFSPDGTKLASGSADHMVIIWDVASGQSLTTLKGHTDWVTSLAFSPDGKRLASAAFEADKVIIWDIASGQPFITLKRDGSSIPVFSVAFSPDGTLLASGSSDSTIILWDVATGQPVTTFKGHTDRVNSVAFSPDGTKLASGSREVILWDVASGQPITTLKGHTSGITNVAFSPDGTKLASSSGEIILWDVASGQLLTTLKGHPGGVRSFAFSPDGTKLASAGDQQVLILDEKFFQPPCQWVTRNLSQGEWERYVSPDLPYQEVCPGLPVPVDN